MLNELDILLHQLQQCQRVFEEFQLSSLEQFDFLEEELQEILIDVLNQMEDLMHEKESEVQSILEGRNDIYEYTEVNGKLSSSCNRK